MGTTMRKSTVALLLSGLLALPACQTTDKGEDPYPKGPSRILFTPQRHEVPIQAGEGAYPNLFTGSSQALWDPEGMKLKAAMMATVEPSEDDGLEGEAGMEKQMEADREKIPPRPVPQRGPLEIVVSLESIFPDRSIAYDAVALRGMDVFLKLPDGTEVLPVQKSFDSALMETPEGALRRYSRDLRVYFPTRNFMVENPAAVPSAAGIRLVLTGLNSIFYFEWHAMPDSTVPLEARKDYQLRDATSKGYRSVSDRAKAISHTFD